MGISLRGKSEKLMWFLCVTGLASASQVIIFSADPRANTLLGKYGILFYISGTATVFAAFALTIDLPRRPHQAVILSLVSWPLITFVSSFIGSMALHAETTVFSDLTKSLLVGLVVTAGFVGFFPHYFFGLVILSALTMVGFYKLFGASKVAIESRKSDE